MTRDPGGVHLVDIRPHGPQDFPGCAWGSASMPGPRPSGRKQLGFLDAEAAEMGTLVAAAKRDAAERVVVGFAVEDILTSERRLPQAQGLDVSGISGVCNQVTMKQLRNRLLALVVMFARHARALRSPRRGRDWRPGITQWRPGGSDKTPP